MIEAKDTKLIVVLGMHRSGTSAITRGLQVLGVALGDRMMAPVEGNNPKGFWEDIDLNALNIEMLSVIKSDWCHTAAIEPIDVEVLRKEGYFLRATELLRQKVGNSPVFGFKDPRVAKLLPFWKQVFAHCKFDVSYLLASRHPLSVVKSLAKRDGIEAGQSYLLWLGHIITALTGSADSKRIVVDYDCLMRAPDHELMRVAKCMGLAVDPAELQSYKTEFLDQGLRHTVFELDDLLVDDACPPLVREVYSALLDVAAEKARLDDQELQSKVARWSDEFERLRSALKLVDKLFMQKTDATQTVAERDGQIAGLNLVVTERDGQIGSLGRAVIERDEQINNLNQAVVGRDGQIIGLNLVVAERDGQIGSLGRAVIERDEQINNLNQAVTEGNGQIASLDQVVVERDGQIARLDQVVVNRDGQIASLNHAIAERDRQITTLTTSRSWRLTKPVRFVGRMMRGEFDLAFDFLRRARREPTAANTLLQALPRAISFYNGSLLLTTRRVWGVLMREGMPGVMRRARLLAPGTHSDNYPKQPASVLYGEMPALDPEFSPKVSVIVPNYNHAQYLRERLDSIYGQTYGNIEVILLDDCSSDESIAILREYAERYADKTIAQFNKVNSGGAFNQWKKGLELATGELVWIAESDDYCSTNLLEELVRSFKTSAVMLAFARSDFVRGTPASKVWTSEEYLADLDLSIWDKPFIHSAHSLVTDGWAIKNLVPNVSSAIFRNPGTMTLFESLEWAGMRLCGDWMFYLSLIRGGLVAYNPSATNYYRQHPLNTSVNAQKEDLYYQEFEVVARHIAENYAIERSCLERQELHLYQHWCSRRGDSRENEFKTLYDLNRIWQTASTRKPNLVMAVYALTAGGGETFPIMLANLLHARGYAVTLLNCCQEVTEPGVRRMLTSSIPLLELSRLDLVGVVFNDMHIELVHSHHAWVDVTLATLLLHQQNVRQVISMHGMYEMMTPAQLQSLMLLLTNRTDRIVYTADKNLPPFPQEFREKKGFCRIDNALPATIITPISRAELGVGTEDFVLCLVARAIPDKGWEEAIAAVAWAHTRSSRKIHLLLIGEGVESERLRTQGSHDFVHFLGFRSNIRDYFAASDIGFLPSRFKGESFPLVLIDCLHTGKPFLASNIGEIRYMLDTDEGLAGELFDLDDWQIPIEIAGQIILTLANDADAYQRLLPRVPLAAARFDAGIMADKYEAVYSDCMATAGQHAADRFAQRKGGRS